MAPQNRQFKQLARHFLKGYREKGLGFIHGYCPWQHVQTLDDTRITAMHAYVGG